MRIGQYSIGYIGYAPSGYRQNTPDFFHKTASRNSHRNYINRDAIRRVRDLTGDASAVLKAVDKLDDRSAYQNYYARSSERTDVKVDYSSQPTAQKDFEIEVDELAAAQTNEGTALDSDTLFSGAAGTHRFEIDIDGNKSGFSVNVSHGDTNNQVMRKIAGAVNHQNIGVEAWVSNDGKADTSALVFQSKKTGDLKGNHFLVSDVGGGTLMSDTGAGRMTQAAQDAVYTVNNTTHTSHDNNIDLGSGVKVTLNDVTGQPVTVSVEKSSRETIDQVKELVKAYNGLLSSAQGSDRLMQSLQVYSGSYSVSFDRVGIERNSDGSLSINDKKLKAAAENGALERLFAPGGFVNYGPSYRLSRIAQNVLDNPLRYGEKSGERPGNYFYGGNNRNRWYPYTHSNRSNLFDFYL